MLYPEYDVVKSAAVLRAEVGKTCIVPGCTEHLTQMQGPGSGVLCRKHQLYMREYGGMGRLNRPWTFHRKRYCLQCGFNPYEDTGNKHYHLKDTNPDLWHRLCRNKLIGDHIIRKADGGTDEEDNIQTLCLNCNSDKTIFNEDWRKPDKKVLLDEDNNVIDD